MVLCVRSCIICIHTPRRWIRVTKQERHILLQYLNANDIQMWRLSSREVEKKTEYIREAKHEREENVQR